MCNLAPVLWNHLSFCVRDWSKDQKPVNFFSISSGKEVSSLKNPLTFLHDKVPQSSWFSHFPSNLNVHSNSICASCLWQISGCCFTSVMFTQSYGHRGEVRCVFGMVVNSLFHIFFNKICHCRKSWKFQLWKFLSTEAKNKQNCPLPVERSDKNVC